jgi:hypothetical protein
MNYTFQTTGLLHYAIGLNYYIIVNNFSTHAKYLSSRRHLEYIVYYRHYKQS